jgi:hypothetical protein
MTKRNAISLTLKELKELGIIKKKKKKNKRKKRKVIYIDANTGKEIKTGGEKSSSSHMKGSSVFGNNNFSNTNNLAIEALHIANEKARSEEIKKKKEEENPDRFALVPAAKPMRDPTVDQNFDHIRTYLLHKEGQVKSAYKNLYDRVLRNEKVLYKPDDSEGAFATTRGSDAFYSHESGLDRTNERIIPQHPLATPTDRKMNRDEPDTVERLMAQHPLAPVRKINRYAHDSDDDSDEENKEIRKPFLKPKTKHIGNPLARPQPTSLVPEVYEPIQKEAHEPIQKAAHKPVPIPPDLLIKFKHTAPKKGGFAVKGQTKAQTSDEIARMRSILFINKTKEGLDDDQIMNMKYGALKKQSAKYN